MARNWVELVIGLWIMISPWLLGFSNSGIMEWSNVVCGLAIVLMSAWVLFGKEPASRKAEEKK